MADPPIATPDTNPVPDPPAATRDAPMASSVPTIATPTSPSVPTTASSAASSSGPADHHLQQPWPAPRPETGVPIGAPARISAAVGALERLLIVAFVLTGAWVAVGLLLVFKTMVRYRQLADPSFLEYYLLGTLASVSVAVLSAEAALGALHTIGL